MRALLSSLTSIVFLAVFSIVAPARAQCPSSGYFHVQAQNPVEGYKTSLNSTICISIRTSPARIVFKSLVVAEILDTRVIEQRLAGRIQGSCTVWNLTGWEISDASVSLLGSFSNARIRVSARARPCLVDIGPHITYQVPLKITLANDSLSFALDVERARLTFTKQDIGVPFGVAQIIAARINSTLEGLKVDLAPYRAAAAYVGELNPVVSEPSMTLASHRITMRFTLSGSLEKADADRNLNDLVNANLLPRLLRLLSAPTS